MYLQAILVMLIFDVVGKIFYLYKQDKVRNLKGVAVDLLVTIVVLAWTAILLVGGKTC